MREKLDAHLPRTVARAVWAVLASAVLSIVVDHALSESVSQHRRASCGRTMPRPRAYRAQPLDDALAALESRGGSAVAGASAHVENGGASALRALVQTLAVPAAMVAAVIAATFALLWLYRTRRYFALRVWLAVSLVSVLSIHLARVARAMLRLVAPCNFMLDAITFAVLIYNVCVTGACSILWCAPRVVNQLFLVLTAVIIASLFRDLPQHAIYILLLALSLWDLFAVLNKHGPLRQLLELAESRAQHTGKRRRRHRHSQERSLLNSARRCESTARQDAEREQLLLFAEPRCSDRLSPTSSVASKGESASDVNAEHSDDGSCDSEDRDFDQRNGNGSNYDASSHGEGDAFLPALVYDTDPLDAGRLPEARAFVKSRGGAYYSVPSDEPHDARESERTAAGSAQPPPRHVKLGLGDFVFYNVLIAAAARSSGGLIASVTCAVVISGGLIATLCILLAQAAAPKQRALHDSAALKRLPPLPALPVSIFAGLFALAASSLLVAPLVKHMLREGLFPM